ncbi:MAG: hypothetical protein JWN14_3008 [Chthonomonadales bacterium]|nr:hypothetical protein [Chthonomonadales bacterium]
MPITPEKALKSVQRARKRLEAQNPLFAAMDALEEVAHVPTVQERIRSIDLDDLKHARAQVRTWIRAFECLRTAQEVLGIEETAARWERFKKTYPPDHQGAPHRIADYYHNLVRERLGTMPTWCAFTMTAEPKPSLQTAIALRWVQKSPEHD